MENNKLGQEPAFGFGYEKEHSYLNQPGKYRTPEKELGMSKRFYAACAAMQALITNFPKERMINDGYIAFTEYSEIIKESYEFADELLKQENA